MLNFMNFLKSGNNLRVKASNRLNEDFGFTNNIQSFEPCLSRFEDELSDLGALIERSSVKNHKDAFSIVIELDEGIRKLRSVINEIQENKRTAVIQPKNLEELKKIIENTIKEKGPNCDLNFIDTSKIKDMGFMFTNSKFNGDISKWNVSNVRNMKYMFANSEFNGDISKWNVSNVRDMRYMFANSEFNGDISKWNVSNVSDMGFMFTNSKFNGDISKWNVSNVRDTEFMFDSCPLDKKPKYRPNFFE